MYVCDLVHWLLYIKIGDESTTTKPQQPITVDDESNQHLVNDDRSSADHAIDANVFNNGDNNIVMQETVGAVG